MPRLSLWLVMGMVAVGVSSIEVIKSEIEVMLENGFLYRPRTETNTHILFACRDEDNTMDTHYIHVVVHNNHEWNEYIKFKDVLNNDIKLKEEYNILKLNLFQEFKNDRRCYSIKKHDFIQKVLDKEI